MYLTTYNGTKDATLAEASGAYKDGDLIESCTSLSMYVAAMKVQSAILRIHVILP